MEGQANCSQLELQVLEPQNPLEKCPSEIWEMIFSCLKDADTSSLLACRETCHDFKYWVDKKASFWSRMNLRKAVDDNNVDICWQILDNVQNKNPADNRGFTTLHWAAEKGHLEICRLILENVQDKNPANKDGITPLHRAARYGRLEICRLILENVQDKNPANNNGTTPLHQAAWYGQLETYRLILENVPDKNPADNRGFTPLHNSAQAQMLKLLMESALRQ